MAAIVLFDTPRPVADNVIDTPHSALAEFELEFVFASNEFELERIENPFLPND